MSNCYDILEEPEETMGLLSRDYCRGIENTSDFQFKEAANLKISEMIPFAIRENPMTQLAGPGSKLRELEAWLIVDSPWSTFQINRTDFYRSTFIPDLNSGISVVHMVNEVLRNNSEFARAVPGYCSLELLIVFKIACIMKICHLKVERYENYVTDLELMSEYAIFYQRMQLSLPAPLAFFIENLGHLTPCPLYGEVSPALPNIGVYNAIGDLNRQHPDGILRIGLLPMEIQLLRNIRMVQHLALNGAKQPFINPLFPDAAILGLPLNGDCFATILGLGQLGQPWTFANFPEDLVIRMNQAMFECPPPPDMAQISFSRWDNFCGLTSLDWFTSLFSRVSTAAKYLKDSSIYDPRVYSGRAAMLLESRDNIAPILVNNFTGARVPYLAPHQTTPMRPRCHFQKIGTLIDFKLGTVLGINAIYNRDNSPLLARGANGPYFETDAQDPQAIQPVVKRQLHVIRSLYPNTPSPLHQLQKEIQAIRLATPEV